MEARNLTNKKDIITPCKFLSDSKLFSIRKKLAFKLQNVFRKPEFFNFRFRRMLQIGENYK